MKITAVMKKNLATTTPEDSLLHIARMMMNNRIGSVVIKNQNPGNPIGIITWSNIVDAVAMKKDMKKVRAEDVMGKNLITVDVNDTILQAARKMVKHRVDRVPVLEKEKLIGIVADKDILAAAPEMLEILSEKLKASVGRPPEFDRLISGICERCEGYSDELRNVDGKWFCPGCGSS